MTPHESLLAAAAAGTAAVASLKMYPPPPPPPDFFLSLSSLESHAADAMTVLLCIATLIGCFLFARKSEDSYVRIAPDAPKFDPRRDKLRVLVWNIQFGASTKHHFWYEGGDARLVPKDDVMDSLEQIAAMIDALDPDLVLLQEVDRGARRTCWIDEHAYLRSMLPKYVSDASTWYWRMLWVPAPLDGGTQVRAARICLTHSHSRLSRASAVLRILPQRQHVFKFKPVLA